MIVVYLGVWGGRLTRVPESTKSICRWYGIHVFQGCEGSLLFLVVSCTLPGLFFFIMHFRSGFQRILLLLLTEVFGILVRIHVLPLTNLQIHECRLLMVLALMNTEGINILLQVFSGLNRSSTGSHVDCVPELKKKLGTFFV
jgi:hypothetical protein